MTESSENILALPAEKWSLKHLMVLLVSVPILMIMVKTGFREALFAVLSLLFFILSLESPKTGIGLLFVLILLDPNPSTRYISSESIFALKTIKNIYIPVNVLFETMLLCGWFLSSFVLRLKKSGHSSLHLPLLIFIGWMTLTQTISVLRGGSLSPYIIFMTFALFYFYYDTLKTRADIIRIMNIIIATLVILLIYSYIKLFMGQVTQVGLKLYLLGSEPVQLLNILGIFALAAGMEKKIRFPLFAGIAVYFICLVQIFFSSSRATFTGSIFCLLLVLFLKLRKNKYALLGAIAALVVIAVLLIAALSQFGGVRGELMTQGFERMSSISAQTEDLAIIFRYLAFPAALKASLKHPILGGGFSEGFYINVFSKNFYATAIDNTYIKLALSTGFPGLILYIICLFILYKTGFSLLNIIEPGFPRCVLITLLATAVMSNYVDMFQVNLAFYRALPVVIFAWAGIMRLNSIYGNSRAV